MLTHGTSVTLGNGGLFTHFLGGGGGAGSDKFLDIRNDGTEQGYNTDAPLSPAITLDTKEPTRAILLSSVPTVTFNGVTYYEFVLDVNETAGQRALILNELRVYTAPTPIDNLTGYNGTARTLGGQLPLYDMDYVGAYPGTLQNSDLLVDGSGSGAVDLAIMIPASVFGTLVPSDNYVYLYSKMGDISTLALADIPAGYLAADFQADDGTEHFAFGTTLPQSPLTDLSITKTDGLATIGPGDSNTYTMTITNNGPTPVTSVQFNDVIPEQYTPTNPANPFTPSTGTYTPTFDALTRTYSGIWTLNLAVGASATISFSGTVALSATQPIVNRAEVYTTGVVGELPSTLGDNVAIDTDTLSPRADLQITKTDGITTIAAGQSLTYTIVVSNAGPSGVTGATIADVFPAELLAVTWNATQSGGASGFVASGSGAINATVTMPAGSTITYTVNATVNPATTSTSLVNTATVATPLGVSDPTPGNNTATDTDSITILADLSVTKTNADSVATPGTPLGYQITVTNSGPSNVVGATVVDTIPASLIGVIWSATATGGATGFDAAGSGNINDTGINMPVGSTITYLVSGTVSPTVTPVSTPTISNTVTVTVPGGVTDPNLGNNSDTHTDTVLPAPTDLSVDKIAPPPVVPGEFATYTVTFTNTNSLGIPVVNAPVTDNFADLSGLFVLGTVTWSVTAFDPGATAGVGAGTDNLLDTVSLPANASITYTVIGQARPDAVLNGKTQIVNTATIDPPDGIGDTNGTNNTVTRTVLLGTPLVDLSITKTDGVDTEIPGTSISYTITVFNAGPSSINSVVLTDTQSFLLPGFSFSPSSGAYTPGTGAWTGLNLAPNTSVSMTLSGIINPAATGSITNTAVVAAPVGVNETNLGNNTASDTDTLTPQADLAITKTDGVGSAIPGQTVTYTIIVSNAGPSNVFGATVADTFPGIITSANWIASQSGGATGFDASGSGSINDSGINMPVGSTITYTVTAVISSAATGSLVNTATVAAPAGVDPNLANNSSTDTDTLTPVADLSITKTDGQSSAIPGTSITYTIVVRNNGASDANGVAIADTIPATITGVSWTAVETGGASGFTSGAGNLFTQNVNMPAGSTITYTVTGTILASASGTLVNTATVTAPGGVSDPVPGNNTATDSDDLVPTADLSVTKDDGLTSVAPGGAVTYTITVTNSGPSLVTGAIVSDLFPAALLGVSWTATDTGGASGYTNGSGNTLSNTVTMPVGSTITYTVTGAVDLGVTSGLLINTARITPPADVFDPAGGNNEATDTDQIEPAPGNPTDLRIVKDDGQLTAIPGTILTYTVTVANLGPNPVIGALVSDTFPTTLTGVSWTVLASGGATGAVAGAGNTILNLVDMPVNSSIVYTVTGTVAANATGSLSNTASITPPAGVSDTNPADNTSTDIDTLTPQADLEITKTDGQLSGIPGTPITYTIVVSNAGPSDVVGATVIDFFPGQLLGPIWTSVASGGASGNTAGPIAGNINEVVNLPAGSSITYTVTGTIDSFATGSLENTAFVDVPEGVTETDPSDNSATDNNTLIPTANLSIVKTDGASNAIPGTAISYTITVTNSGPSAAVNATVYDSIPLALTGVTWTAVSLTGASGFTASGSGNLINDTSVVMPVGSTILYTIVATIDPAAAGSLANTATVTPPPDVTDPNPGDNSSTDTDQLIPTGNLTVTKDNGVAFVVAGQAAPVVYTITISNSGPSTLTSLTLDDLLPPASQFTFGSLNLPAGSSYDPVSKVLSGITLVPGGSIFGTLSGTIPSSATGTLTNTVTVTPPNGTGDSATDSDPITLVADLRIEKTDLSHLLRPGESIPYFITVWNDGPSDVIGATLSDVFPPEMLPNAPWSVTFTSAGASSTPSSGTGDINALLTIPAGGTIQLQVNRTLSPTILPPATTSNTATIAVPIDVTDPNPLNNSSTHTDTILPAQTDLSVDKTGPTTVIPGQTASYSVTFTNTNSLNIPVIGASVTDTFSNLAGIFVPGSVTWQVTLTSAGASAVVGNGTGDLADTITLPAGGFITYSLTGTVRPEARGQINNTAQILPPAGVEDTNGLNNTDSVTVTLTPIVDLSVQKSDGAAFSIPGTPITYTIILTNLGPSALNASDGPITLIDTPQFLLLGYTLTASSGIYDPTTGTWTGLNLAPLGTASLTLTGTIDPAATGTMTNIAVVTPPGTVTDPDPNNNTAIDQNTLTPQSNVSIVKTNPISTPNFYSEIPGLPVSYLITVSNAGPSNATGVVVSDVFPAILLNPSWTATETGGAVGFTANGTGNINDTVTLPAGSSIVYLVTALIDPTATGTLSNTATATAQNDTNPEDNTSTHSDQLTPEADLGVTKTSNVPSAVVGGTLIYTITVTNFGPSTVGSFTLTEVLPPQLTISTQIPSAGSYNPATGAWSGISLATGQSVTLTVTGTVMFGAGGNITNSAVVAPPPGVNDYNASNDSVVLSLPAIPRPIIISGPADPLPLLPLPQASKRSLLSSTMAANDPLTGPYRAAVADFNQDGVPETVIASAPGVPDRVVVTDGATGHVLFSIAPFGGSFTGGLFVTTGDITGDQIPDLVVSPDQGGGPRVQVYSGAGFTKFLGNRSPHN